MSVALSEVSTPAQRFFWSTLSGETAAVAIQVWEVPSPHSSDLLIDVQSDENYHMEGNLRKVQYFSTALPGC